MPPAEREYVGFLLWFRVRRIHMNLGPGISARGIVQPLPDDEFCRAPEDQTGPCWGHFFLVSGLLQFGGVRRPFYLLKIRTEGGAEPGRNCWLWLGRRRRRSRDSGKALKLALLQRWPLAIATGRPWILLYLLGSAMKRLGTGVGTGSNLEKVFWSGFFRGSEQLSGGSYAHSSNGGLRPVIHFSNALAGLPETGRV